MPAKINHKVHQQTVKAILQSPSGGVAKDLFRRGKKVESAAKRNLQRPPRRINTGYLRSSIHTQLITGAGAPYVVVGTNVWYAVLVHDGTGIYGPKGTYIVPKVAKALSWRVKGGKRIFALKVKGMRPNPFLKDALPAAKD